MFRQVLTWRTLLALTAILIVSGTIWYSSYLAQKIEQEERQKAFIPVMAVDLVLATFRNFSVLLLFLLFLL